jgi:hypothetical protein
MTALAFRLFVSLFFGRAQELPLLIQHAVAAIPGRAGFDVTRIVREIAARGFKYAPSLFAVPAAARSRRSPG